MTTLTLARRALREVALSTSFGYRAYLKREYGVTTPLGFPKAPWKNAALKTRREWEAATAQVSALGLPSCDLAAKNWDSLAALAFILHTARASAPILDAGAALNSMILPWLFLYGYTNLRGIGFEFRRTRRRGPIRYQPGDITRSGFAANSFEVVVCQSVLEHGVDVPAYLKEMARILRPGGVLMTSVDYYTERIDTSGLIVSGLPYHLFSEADIAEFLALAASLDLAPTDPIDLVCEERAVKWEKYGLAYTFLMLTLRKRAPAENR